MMLWKRMSDEFALMGITVSEDGEGGTTTTYVEAARFYAAVAAQSSEVEENGANRAHQSCTIVGERALYHDDIVVRVRDGKAFRVTTDPQKSPASFDFYVSGAEEWRMPSE